jgi:Phosphotransferase enzyme family
MATYRGSIYLQKIITAEKNGQNGFVILPPDDEARQLLRIQSIQCRLPMAAQILDVIESRIFVVARAPGVLLWEMEDGLPARDEIRLALDSLVESLKQVGLVHGDIRPWNVFYDASHKHYKIIDWGFSFFLDSPPCGKDSRLGHLAAGRHEPPYSHVDRDDVNRTIQIIAGELSCEDAWAHRPDELTWRPKWAKRKN